MKRLSRSLEDYLEVIYLLHKEKGYARVTDIANRLSVKKPSVVSALKRLEDLGFIIHEKYGRVSLTSEGVKKAQDIYERHIILLRFFRDILGVPHEEAERDACIVEHYLGNETIDKLTKFVMFVDVFWQKGVDPKWLERFRKFVEDQELPPCERLKD